MNVFVLGTGYVGLVASVCFAELGFHVVGIDSDPEKVVKLQKGEPTIFEPGLENLMRLNIAAGRVKFQSHLEGIEKADAIILAVGTPSQPSGDADLSDMYQALRELLPVLSDHHTHYIIIKSTVPVGTAAEIVKFCSEYGKKIQIISNPEFLREGSAVHDFLSPDRIIVGCASDCAIQFVKELYAPLVDRNIPLMITTNVNAEVIKYASNSYLATRIAFINEISDLAKKVGGDINEVTHGMGLDRRIGSHYLKSGPGFGGSCFPKDIRALSFISQKQEVDMRVLNAVITSNDNRKSAIALGIADFAIENKCDTVAIWGLAFKAETDDVRESPSITIVQKLLDVGVNVRVYDPEAAENFTKCVNGTFEVCQTAHSAAEGASLVVLVTEWSEFLNLNYQEVKNVMNKPFFLDLRNIVDRNLLSAAGIIHIPQ